MRDGGTNQPAPLVYNGTMYLANTGGIVQALDARTGQPDLGAPRRRRGRAARPRALRQPADLPQRGGVGRQPAGRASHRARRAHRARPSGTSRCRTSIASNSGPIIANGLLIQGMGTCTVYEEKKCFISAYDPATGEQRWRFSTIALDGEPGGDTWGDAAGSLSRRRRSLDHRQLRPRPESHLLGHDAGQAVDAGEPRHGDGRTSRSTRARRSRSTRRTRQARVVLPARARRSVRSRRRVRARARRCRPREVGVLGRQGRRALEARSEAPASTSVTSRRSSRTSGRASIPKTGRPRYRPDILEHKVGEWIDACPSTAGGKNWHAMSFHAPSRQLIIPLEPELRVAARASRSSRVPGGGSGGGADRRFYTRCRARTATSASSPRSTSTR